MSRLDLRRPIVRALTATVLVVALVATTLAAGSKKVIGKLGQTLRDVGIHSKMSEHSRTLFYTKESEYLAVNATKSPNWVSVVMANGSKGYIPADAVAVLPYNVLRSAPSAPPRDQYLASRSNGFVPRTSLGDVADLATTYVGTPYKWGGENLQSGIDCSGFVKKMFGAIGIHLPRTAAEQALVGQPITRLEELQKGDRLYFWDSGRGKIGHTGIFLGYVQGVPYFVHSSHGKGGVATSQLTNSWCKLLIAARR